MICGSLQPLRWKPSARYARDTRWFSNEFAAMLESIINGLDCAGFHEGVGPEYIGDCAAASAAPKDRLARRPERPNAIVAN